MQIKINGTIDQMPDDATISDVLASRTLREEMAIVLVNGEVTRREEWGSVKLSPLDNLEIIRIVGGG